jgi:lipopolysaccharide export system protein LptA
MSRLFSTFGWLVGAAVMLAGAAAVAAQPAKQAEPAQQSSGAMAGFSANRDQPVKITSNTLEVRDKIHQATFSGDVKLVQGDTTITCRALTVFYEEAEKAKKGAPPPDPNAQKQSNTQIKRAEAKGDVLITQKDQTATGDNGVYDMKSNTMTLTGNVVVTQGASVMRGERMVVNLTTGVTKVDGTRQIEFLTTPGASKDGKAPPAPTPQPASPPPAAKAAPKGPIRIN